VALSVGKYTSAPGFFTGAAAIVASNYFLIQFRGEIDVVVASIYFTLVCATDTLKNKIPNILNAGLILAGVCFNGWQNGLSGVFTSVTGLVLGIGLLLLFYLMGGVGAGDVKALGAVGALVGPTDLLHIFVYMGFFGGGLAILHYLFYSDVKSKLKQAWVSVQASVLTRDPAAIRLSHKSEKTSLRFPYATAIAFGYYAFLVWGEVI